MAAIKTAVTYYTLTKRYKDEYGQDVTKKCGLTGPEIDNNFHFLRGRDLENVAISGDSLVFTLLNGGKIVVDDFGDYIAQKEIDFSGTTYVPETGELTILTNGTEEIVVSGFLTEDDFKISVRDGAKVGNGLKGDGSEEQPISILSTERTGVFASVNEYYPLATGQTIDDLPNKEFSYLTRVWEDPCGGDNPTWVYYICRYDDANNVWDKTEFIECDRVIVENGDFWPENTEVILLEQGDYYRPVPYVSTTTAQEIRKVYVAISGLSASTEEAISKEERERKRQDTLIRGALSAETEERKRQDNLINEALSAETRERINQDNLLSDKIESEKNARISADTALAQQITDEKNARISADTTERNERKAADNVLSGYIEDVRTAITKEISDRTAADNALGQRIDTETSQRTEQDNVLSGQIAAEKAAREDAINILYELLETISGGTFSGVTEVYELSAGTVERFNTLEQNVRTLSASTESLSAATGEKLESLGAALSALSSSTETAISNINGLIEELSAGTEEELDKLIQELSSVTQDILAIEGDIANISGETENIKEIVENISNSVAEIIEELISHETSINDLSALTQDIIEDVADLADAVSANTFDIEILKEKIGEGSFITEDISGKTADGTVVIIAHSGDSVTDAAQGLADFISYSGGTGDGKVKDIIINGESILDEETGIANLNIIGGDEDISVDYDNGDLKISVNGISNNTIILE